MSTRLDEEEARLAEQVGQVELLGQLALAREDVQRLEESIEDLVQRRGMTRATDMLRDWYPHCLAVYLVGKGIFDFKAGDYWSSVREGLRQRNTRFSSDWGSIFLSLLQRWRLPDFKIEGALPFVTPILIHGGIPEYCLSDFFRYLLLPAANTASAGRSARDLIDDWLALAPGSRPVDKPVWRFLAHGGEMAVDLVDRCLDLARRHAQRRVVPSAEEVGLPVHVVAAFERWIRDGGLKLAAAGSTMTMRRPEIRLEPWGDGLVVDLPAHMLAVGDRPPAVVWTISAGGEMVTQPVRALRRRDGWHTESDRIALAGPAAEYAVSVTDGRGSDAAWRFAGLSPRTPVLAFDPGSGRLVQWRGALPARDLWLLHVGGSPVDAPDGVKKEELPRLPWRWSHFRVERWDLQAARELRTGGARIAVRPEGDRLRPHLDGGQTLHLQSAGASVPIYVGSLPRVIIPFETVDDSAARLDRWTIVVNDAAGAPLASLSLAALGDRVEHQPRAVSVPLALPELLGDRACGTFEVRLRGPLGRDAAFTLALVPRLQISGHERVRLPDERGHVGTARLLIDTAPELTVLCQDTDVQVAPLGMGRHRVTIPADRGEVTLTVDDGRTAGVDLTVPLPALRRATVERDGALAATAWHTTPVLQPIAWLEQAKTPALLASLTAPGAASAVLSGQLLVREPFGRLLQAIQPRHSSSRWLEFSLAAARDTILASGLASVQIDLELVDPPGHGGAIDLPVMMLTRALAIDNLALDGELSDETWHLALTWHDAPALRHRRLRLWSLWRPWQSPIEEEIPDTASSGHAFTLSRSALPPGDYRAEMVVVDPWAPAPARRPASGAPNSAEASFGSAAERFYHLWHLPKDVLGCLERAMATSDALTRDAALADLGAIFRPEHVPLALEALRSLAGADDPALALIRAQGDTLQALRDLILSEVDALLVEIGRLACMLDGPERQALRRLLLALGLFDLVSADRLRRVKLPDATLTALWHFWPPLALLVDGGALVRGDVAAWRRGQALLGLDPLATATDSGLAARPRLPSLVERGDAGQLFGTAPNAAELQAPLPRVRQIHACLNLIPRGLLDTDAYPAANLSWLLALRGDAERWRAAHAWQEKRQQVGQVAIKDLRDARLIPSRLADLIGQRHSRRWIDEPGNLPFMVGAGALVLRTLATGPTARRVLSTDGRDWRRWALRAFDFAPDLFTRDLCLIDLALVQGGCDMERADGDHTRSS